MEQLTEEEKKRIVKVLTTIKSMLESVDFEQLDIDKEIIRKLKGIQ